MSFLRGMASLILLSLIAGGAVFSAELKQSVTVGDSIEVADAVMRALQIQNAQLGRSEEIEVGSSATYYKSPLGGDEFLRVTYTTNTRRINSLVVIFYDPLRGTKAHDIERIVESLQWDLDGNVIVKFARKFIVAPK